MRNQPRYNFFKNTKYAYQGLVEVFSHEKSLQTEIIIGALLAFVAIFLPIDSFWRFILIASMVQVIIIEIINSAIERVVDLVTKEHNELAKNAKDAGSAAVFVAICISALAWIYTIIKLVY